MWYHAEPKLNDAVSTERCRLHANSPGKNGFSPSLYIYTYIHINICIYIYLFMYVCMYIYIHIYVYIYIDRFIYFYTHTHTVIQMYMHVSIYLLICVRLTPCRAKTEQRCLRVNSPVNISYLLSIYLSICLYSYIHI